VALKHRAFNVHNYLDVITFYTLPTTKQQSENLHNELLMISWSGMKTVIIHLMTGGGARLGYEGADAPCAWPC